MSEAPMVKACRMDQLPPGVMVSVEVSGRIIVVANAGGELYAMDGLCKHAGWNLAQGRLNGTTITCAGHGAQWNLETGRCIRFFKDLAPERTYTVVSREGDVLIQL